MCARVLCSSRSDQLSYDYNEYYLGGVLAGFESCYYWVNGTDIPVGLIGGMTAGTDKNNDGWLSVLEIFDFANASVILFEQQNPVYYNGLDFDPPLLEVRRTGDINLDGIVNVSDAILVEASFGSYAGHPNWNSLADLRSDNTINIFDAIILSSNFGRHS